MEISPLNSPFAGSPFRFVVREGSGRTQIKAYLDKQLLWEEDCDDPPCHEIIPIPEGASGSTLRIVATDSVGHIEEKAFSILGTGSSSSWSSSSSAGA